MLHIDISFIPHLSFSVEKRQPWGIVNCVGPSSCPENVVKKNQLLLWKSAKIHCFHPKLLFVSNLGDTQLIVRFMS